MVHVVLLLLLFEPLVIQHDNVHLTVDADVVGNDVRCGSPAKLHDPLECVPHRNWDIGPLLVHDQIVQLLDVIINGLLHFEA